MTYKKRNNMYLDSFGELCSTVYILCQTLRNNNLRIEIDIYWKYHRV